MTTNQTIDGVPRALLERLAKIEDLSFDEDNGPGRNLCPMCSGAGQWNWRQGSVVSIDPIEHEADCPLDELRALLDAPAKLPVIDAHNERLIASLRNRVTELEAAQPQGEPVAYRYRSNVENERSIKGKDEWHLTESKGVVEFFHKMNPLGESQPLYAEQPAPKYNRTPIARDDHANARLVLIAREAAISSSHRYSYMPTTPEDALQWEPHSWVIDAMRMVEQPAPVAVITYQQVFKAYEYAESHPHKYLRGTTNWCSAVAHSLNIK